MDTIDGFRRSCPRRSVRTALPPAASPPTSCDTGRAAAGRAGSFNSGKNLRKNSQNNSNFLKAIKSNGMEERYRSFRS